MKFSIFMFFSILFFASCGKEVAPTKKEIAYYHFNETDNKKLLPYSESKLLSLKMKMVRKEFSELLYYNRDIKNCME